MPDVKISQLPAGTANSSAVVPATNAAGTLTEKITLGAIAALGGGPPASHTHGNITNAGAIGTTSGLPVKTGASGVLEAGAFGTTSGTFCQGNDSRLSDSRTPTSHASTHQTGGSDAVANVVSSPSQITADQNDYALPAADIVRLDANAARNITGFAAGTSGQAVLLINVGSYAITIKHQSTSSSAANRVVVSWAGDYVMDANGGAAVLVYDSTTSRWRAV